MSPRPVNRVYPFTGQTVTMTAAGDDAERSEGEKRRKNPSGQVGGTRRFLPAVEGMRACAAIGVVITHVAFDTGHSSGVDGRLFGRFDLAVAVFFALSGFLLWRGHAAAARGLGSRPPTVHYLRPRGVRISRA